VAKTTKRVAKRRPLVAKATAPRAVKTLAGRDGRPLIGVHDVAQRFGLTAGGVRGLPAFRRIMINLSPRVKRWDPADLDTLVKERKGRDPGGE